MSFTDEQAAILNAVGRVRPDAVVRLLTFVFKGFMSSQFHCTSIEDYGNQRAAIVRGSLQAGAVSPGMSICIALSATFDMMVPISAVLDSGELLVDCDDQEGVDNLLAFGIANEYIRVAS